MKENAMAKMLLCLMMTVLALAGGPGCTRQQGEEEEKSGIEALSRQAGRDATEEIQKPIGKARAIEDLAKKRVQEMDAAEAPE
jgi:hypothetical protein